MTYDTYVKDGHHRVNMGPPIRRGVRIKIDDELFERIQKKVKNVGEAFRNFGMQIHYATKPNAQYSVQIRDGHHRVLIYQPDPVFESGVHEMMERYDGTMRALAERSSGGDADAEGAGEDGQT